MPTKRIFFPPRAVYTRFSSPRGTYVEGHIDTRK